ncbi:uncharacterized protein BDV14DRAFT_200599 [Aspergillus stella-maris]|uniref:uncharacterized protein n=1 Tax=Aspergillus stella-maris TaxID=1810926 RepID=UPI003CCDDD46
MSCSIDLGQRLFSSSNSGLNLSLQASALILLAAESPLLNNSQQLKEVLTSGDLWVTQTPELKLNLCVASGVDLHPSFISQVGQIVCRAKMWSDLGLAVAYKSCVYEPTQTSTTCLLSFGIQKRLGHPPRARGVRIPKLLRDVPDAIPPTGVPTGRISTINVRLQYSHVSQQYPSQHPLQDLASIGKDTTALTELGDWYMDVMDRSRVMDPTVEEASDLFTELDLDGPNDRWDDSNPSEFGTLFQDALAILVFGDKRWSKRHNRIADDRKDGFVDLSRIAPSVFKIGYSESLSQRSRLIPSVAKSLTSMLERSDNQALKDKVSSIKLPRHPDLDASNSPTGGNGANLKSKLKTGLWTITQKRLYHAPTPKHLKPCPSPISEPEPDETSYLDDDDILTEHMSENSALFDDDCSTVYIGLDLHSDLYADSINDNPEPEPEPDLDSQLDIDETDAQSSSIMILGDNDNHTEHSAAIEIETLEDQDHIYTYPSNRKPIPTAQQYIPFLFPEGAGSIPSYKSTMPIPPVSTLTDSDHEMLDFDFDTPDGHERSLPSQKSYSLQCQPGLSSEGGEDEDEMLCDEPWA